MSKQAEPGSQLAEPGGTSRQHWAGSISRDLFADPLALLMTTDKHR